jgi:hypothetical protein
LLSERGTWRELEVVGWWNLAENEYEMMILGKVGERRREMVPK